MLKRIFKYRISEQVETLILPKGYKILKVDEQAGDIHVWAEVPVDDKDKESLEIVIIPTGQHFDSEDVGDYLGTVFSRTGFVWHVYAKKI